MIIQTASLPDVWARGRVVDDARMEFEVLGAVLNSELSRDFGALVDMLRVEWSAVGGDSGLADGPEGAHEQPFSA